MALTEIPIELSSTPGIVDNSNATAITIDSSENVGIGMTPSAWHANWTALQLGATGFVGQYQAGATDITALGSNVFSDGAYKYIETDEAVMYKQQNGEHIFDVAASGSANAAISWTTALTINNTGNVGIGRSSNIDYLLDVQKPADAYIRISSSTTQENAGIILANQNNTKWTIEKDGSAHNLFVKSASLTAMTISQAGIVLIGTTDSTLYNNTSGGGINLFPNGSIHCAKQSTTTTDPAMLVNNTGENGDILQLRKDGAVVGKLANTNAYFFISGGSVSGTHAGLRFIDRSSIRPCTATGGNLDNIIDLGNTAARFDDIYATNGTIQTSDRNEKQDIAELSDAEQRVAVAAKGLLRKFRWKGSVEEKGDEARTHFGIIAQDLQAAFAAEGLDAGDYAMFISSTWTDEETNEEKTRMGVRYSELLAFIIAAI